MLIFKGTQNGWIMNKEFLNFPTRGKHYCEENMWTDKGAMIEKVENILKPYIKVAPENIVPPLLLDSY